MRNDLVMPAFCIGIFLVNKRNSTEAALQRSYKIFIREVTFQSDSLLAVAVEQKHGRRPDGIETVEPRWMFLYVGVDRKEILVDEVGGLLIAVRLGFQPSTGSSRRSRTEIQQNGSVSLFGCDQRLVYVLAPIERHVTDLLRDAANLTSA